MFKQLGTQKVKGTVVCVPTLPDENKFHCMRITAETENRALG
jgi:hypothetical protein